MIIEKEALESLEATSTESEHLRNSLDVCCAAQEKIVEDLKLITHDLKEECSRKRSLQQQLDENQWRLELRRW